jgi:hypothetical protein
MYNTERCKEMIDDVLRRRLDVAAKLVCYRLPVCGRNVNSLVIVPSRWE